MTSSPAAGRALGGAEDGAEEPRTPAPLARRRAAVIGVEDHGAYRLIWASDTRGPPDPCPGQFYMLATADRWGSGDGRPYLPRAFSHARVVRDGAPGLGFLLDAVGPGTHRLGELEPGEELGSGTTVLLGFRSAAHADAAELFAATVAVATDDGSRGRHALVTDLLGEELDRDSEAAVYACGPPPMLEAVRALCAARGTPAQLALESGMACGFGACFGCVVPTRDGFVRLCLDGPVLDADRLETALFEGAGQ